MPAHRLQDIFSEYSLYDTWVKYAESVQDVMDVFKMPVSTTATNLPILFQDSGADAAGTYPEFSETVGAEDETLWPVPPTLYLAQSHISGSQESSEANLMPPRGASHWMSG